MNSIELEKELRELHEECRTIREWQSSVNQLCSRMMEVIVELKNEEKKKDEEIDFLKKFAYLNRCRIDSLPYELQDPDYKSFFFKPNILSKDETIEALVGHNKSFSRFGDGEFGLISGIQRWNYQQADTELGKRLKETLLSDDENLLIGLNPTFYMNLFDIDQVDADGIRTYMDPDTRRLHARLLRKDKQYADALFHFIETGDDVSRLKRIWENRDCVIVEGKHTCSGVGNDLFENSNSIGRIICPAENAFERYDAIVNEVSKQSKEKLIIISLGPTATVLAYDLCKEGYQAIDIGHIDLYYERYLRKAKALRDVFIPYKYCNCDETVKREINEEPDDPRYREQIISTI